MRQLVDTEEAAKILGISPWAIQKRFQRGKLEGELKPSDKGGGKSGMKLYVWIDPPTLDNEELRRADEEINSPSPQSSPSRGEEDKKSRTRVGRGEPGCHVVTPMTNGEPQSAERIAQSEKSEILRCVQDDKIVEALPSEMIGAETSSASIVPTPDGGASPGDSPENPGTVPILRPSSGLVAVNLGQSPNRPGNSPRSLRIANLRFALIQAFNEEAAKNHPSYGPGNGTSAGRRPRWEIVRNFLNLYNAGISHPTIYNDIRTISRSTLYNWLQLNDQGGVDALCPQYRGAETSAVLPGEKDFLLKFLLNQNKPKISDGIRECKRYLGEYSISGPSTLRRFINDFKTQYHDVWTLRRSGEKAWNDEDAPYQDRDPMLLNVGDVIVADGKKLNLDVIDPLTGKKKRATLVLFWDWKSTYPLGWEIMFSENTQCIAVALRNALLTLGKIPGNIYIDNGRAFLAKIFTRNVRIEETEIPGMIARLGSQYRRAMAYHGQSKPIERFFLIINDRLERRLPSYTGASINDKPAYLLRNEKLAKQLHDNWVPTVDDVFNIMLQWREEYIDEPRPRRQGLTARQIFDDGKGAGLDPKALCFLMMAVEVKSVRRSRFTFAGIDWEGPCLYGYHGKVLIRYSLSDFRQIYIFDTNDRYMGEVTQCGKADPIKDWQAAKRIVKERRKLKKHSKELAAFLVEGRRNPDLIEYIEAEETKKPENKKLSPFTSDLSSERFQTVPYTESMEQGEASPQRPRWKYDYEKYDWLMEQAVLTPEDLKWIGEYRASSSLYKHTVFDDTEELNRKVIGPDRSKASHGAGGENERSLCSDQVD